MSIFQQFLSQPLFNILIIFYNFFGSNFGLAIIFLTILIKLVLYPLTQKSIRSQKALNELSPKIKEIKQVHKNDKQKQGEAMMGLYKEHKINPLGGCLPMLIQIPILIALYQVFRAGLDPAKLGMLYSFVHQPVNISTTFLHFIDLSKPNIYLALITGVAQFFYSKLMVPKKGPVKDGEEKKYDFAQSMSSQMVYMMPAIMIYFLWTMPSALAVYWLTMTLFGIGEQIFIKNKSNGKITTTN